MPVPHNLPVPSDVIVPREEPTATAPEAGPTSAPSSPAPSSSFLALEDNNTSIPPDTHGAVGPNHLMVTLNSQVRIQDRTGGVISTVSLEGFWAGLGPFTTDSGVFDPRVLYDPYGNRWMFTACADPSAATSSLLIGVSQTSDPTGTWNLHRADGDAADLVWVDYPSMGFNKDWIVVQVNMFENCGESNCFDGIDNDGDGDIDEQPFNRSHIYVFNKANLYAGGAGSFTLISDDTIGGTQVPAITYNDTLPILYLVETCNGNLEGSGFLCLFTITGEVGSEVLTEVGFPNTPNPWDYAPPGFADFAPQLGSTQKIQTNDDRMQNVVYRNGSIWAVHHVFLPAGGSPTRTAVQWWELSPLGGVQQFGRIDDETGNTFYALPSIAVNQNNDALIGYSRFSATQYASANYSFRAASDPLNTLQADTVLKEGEAPYYKISGGTENRWGDYSNTVVDPVNDTDMWTIQEYAATPSEGFDRWGTWWGRIVPPEVPSDLSITKADSPDPVTVGESLTYTVTVTNNGPETATGVTVTDTLPGSVTFISATPSQGSCSGTSTITCSLGSLANGASATVTIVVTPTAAGEISNTATVTGNETDPDTADNTATAVTAVAALPDLTGEFTSLTRKSFGQLNLLSFTLTVQNSGTAATEGAFGVDFYLSADTVFDDSDLFLTSLSVSDPIEAGEAVELSGRLRVSGPTSGQFVLAVVDANGDIEETDEGNNVVAGAIP